MVRANPALLVPLALDPQPRKRRRLAAPTAVAEAPAVPNRIPNRLPIPSELLRLIFGQLSNCDTMHAALTSKDMLGVVGPLAYTRIVEHLSPEKSESFLCQLFRRPDWTKEIHVFDALNAVTIRPEMYNLFYGALRNCHSLEALRLPNGEMDDSKLDTHHPKLRYLWVKRDAAPVNYIARHLELEALHIVRAGLDACDDIRPLGVSATPLMYLHADHRVGRLFIEARDPGARRVDTADGLMSLFAWCIQVRPGAEDAARKLLQAMHRHPHKLPAILELDYDLFYIVADEVNKVDGMDNSEVEERDRMGKLKKREKRENEKVLPTMKTKQRHLRLHIKTSSTQVRPSFSHLFACADDWGMYQLQKELERLEAVLKVFPHLETLDLRDNDRSHPTYQHAWLDGPKMMAWRTLAPSLKLIFAPTHTAFRFSPPHGDFLPQVPAPVFREDPFPAIFAD